jgi:Carboxypeptidase regulatory-like domain
MLRWTKWVAPMAALVLMAGIQTAQTRADDAATPTGKATVTVTVVDGSGKAVAGATVSISLAAPKKTAAPTSQPTDGTAKPRPTPIETGTTGTDGTFALTKIPDGDFTVSARLKGAGNGRAKVTIADDKDEAVSVTLKARAAKN